MGEDWISYDDYCFPVLKGFCNNDEAKLSAIEVLLDESDMKNNVATKDFFIGHPEGVTVDIDNADVVVDGNKIHFNRPFTGELILTLTLGNSVHEISVDCDVKNPTTVINTVETEDGLIKNEYFSASGVKVAKPKAGGKSVYVVVKTYSDGTQKVVKEVR